MVPEDAAGEVVETVEEALVAEAVDAGAIAIRTRAISWSR